MNSTDNVEGWPKGYGNNISVYISEGRKGDGN